MRKIIPTFLRKRDQIINPDTDIPLEGADVPLEDVDIPSEDADVPLGDVGIF